MSIQIKQTVLLKINQEEYKHLMLCRELNFTPTEKGLRFLKIIKDKMPFGECHVFSKDGQPWRIERAIASEILGLEKGNA